VNSAQKSYSPFWPLLIFFAAVLVFDLDQTVKIHRQKLEIMQQYAQAKKLQPQAAGQLKWIAAMREDLLRLAPGDAEASHIVEELHLQPEKSGH
jgi:hypothetical protein